ncbi:response regulator transcription factor [Rhabdobacter roseus]|uniref:DNA-binding NarL/FixJ family response regulator n=1 Tax=Rhabdobacter roseus TaxID=1655419 RepID=A0A840U690_9BACT|nr:response regulator transcription factor [Rhabdobacter roseus]MBB5287339.1 DNA-binding NarL/FixJ family response regulator [Rhabdobacter roseus]
MPSPIDVLLVDDHQIILDSLSLLIGTLEGVNVVGTLNDSRKVAAYLEAYPVDVLITDLTMPYLDGIQLTLQLRQKYPDLKILMLTVADDLDPIQDAYRAGVSGYVMKKAERAELEKALRTVASGQKYFGEAVMKELLTAGRQEADEEYTTDFVQLTRRELEIVRLIAQELSTSEIADKLFISVGTVETHRHNIMRKLGAKNVIGIIKYALKYKLL